LFAESSDADLWRVEAEIYTRQQRLREIWSGSMPNGTIKFFNAAKGFGFVTPDEGGKDVYVPAASVTSAGLPTLKAGQPISFDVEPDGKGAKAVGLKLISRPQPQKAPPREQPENPPESQADRQLTFYQDPSWDKAAGILAELRNAGHEPCVVDYMTAPPVRDELKRLSVLLRSAGQSLVKRYDPLFLALNLDDRFISENDYWDAIVEHPSLINGPLVAVGARASICQSKDAMKAFLAADSSRDAAGAPEKKGISERLLRLMGGASPASLPEREKAPSNAEVVPFKKVRDEGKLVVLKKATPKVEPKAEPEPEPKPEPKVVAKIAVRPKPKAAVKPKTVKPVKTKAKAAAPKPKKAVKAAPRKTVRKAARAR
jgi:CspA family cold shock protein